MTHNEELKVNLAQVFLVNASPHNLWQDMTMWSIKHLQDLAEILDLVPDASPCDLAVIIRKPCCEVRDFLLIII